LIHQNLDDVLKETNVVDRMSGRSLNGQAKGAALSRFESAKQRFFGQLLIAMKLPTMLTAIQQDVAEARHAVVQLVTTAEAMLDRRLADLPADERAHLDIELSPREYLIDYLNSAFPTRMMRVFKGTDGENRSELMTDGDGRPVHSQFALQTRENLIERLCAMPAIPSALDELIRHFGTDGLAEVTGRTRRLIVDSQGRQQVERRTARSNIAEADAFMSGDKAVLAFSDAGGTGRSYHADRNCRSAHRRRVHYLLEPGWRASSAIQGLGRTNRTNQLTPPIFRPVTTNCRGERRFISTIARRLDSLGALTRGQRQTGGQNLFDPADNLESDYAKEALHQWYNLLYLGKLKSTTLDDFVEMTGLKLTEGQGGGLVSDLPPIQRWLNRLLALRIGTQDAIFEEYMALIQARIDAARDAGTLDVGVEAIKAERMVVLEEQILRRDPVTGAETKLSRLELHHRRRATPFKRLMDEWSDARDVAFLKNGKSGRVALRVPSWSILDNEGRSIQVWQLIRPVGSERIRQSALAESYWQEIGEESFRQAWDQECADIAARVDIETINIATGLLLPVWNRLPDDDVRVWRISDEQGNSLLGRIVSPAGFEKLAQSFGITMAIALSPAELIAGARGYDGVAIPSLPGTRLQRVHVNGEARLEVKDFPPARREWLKSLGCFTEIIAYKTRLFVPTNHAEDILSAIGRPGDALRIA
ncbi:strawberry notch C-terminal domain-containing protein, partial [Novosphingobium naphthalenivorans]|uniref:strawberry notch C-terminal domain-containing protein n=1 Tax=Novosphingobium naphthalenivorans TaxID=273168 RepID=UPI000B0FF2C7